ncbi:MAG: tetratricopeptide repeat protein [Bacteroidetes bacterium]|nr:tetratricopeptide repeat protein [Bacteroidota bacterium]
MTILNSNLKLLTAFAVLFCFSLGKSYSQKNVELINSGEIINQAVEFHDEGEYEQAIKLYEKISRNDTNYSMALAELSLSLLKNEDYERTKEVCRRGIKLDSEEGYMFYTHYATALDDSEDPDSAIIIYKQGIEKYPREQGLHFNLGITYYREKKYQEAIDVLKKSILLNPYHSSSHMALGKICAELGYVTQAMLSLNMFLILEPGTDRSVEFLKYMDNWLGSDMDEDTDNKVVLSEEGDDFTSIDVLIRNRVALNSKYKPKSKLTYPVVMQTQVLFEKLKYKKNDGGFWMENYVPIFKDIYNDGHFAPYIYYILSNLKSENVQKLVTKNKKKIKKLVKILNGKVLELRGTRTIEWDGKERDMQHWYYESNKISAIGEYDQDKEIKKGYWEYYFLTGNISSKGRYDSKGGRTGLWEMYYHNGNIKERANINEGKLDGYYTYYYLNGQPTSQYFYKEGEANDSVKYYSKVGAITGMELYENDVLSGEGKRYFNNGKVKFSYSNKNGKIDGKIIEYDPQGHIIYESDFKDGKRNGIYKTYYFNGKLKSETITRRIN